MPGGRKRQAQCGGRTGLPDSGVGTQQDQQQIAGARQSLQSQQRGIRRLVGPAHQGGTNIMANRLFGGPEAVGRVSGTQPGQPAGLQAPVCPALHGRGVGRVDQQDQAVRIERGQGRSQELDFADAGPFRQEFDQGAQWPAAARQHAIEGCMPCRHDGAAQGGGLAGAPQRGMDALGVLKNGGCGHGDDGSFQDE